MYLYCIEIVRKNGSVLNLTITSENDVKARLKSKMLAKNGSVRKIQRYEVPIKTTNESINDITEKLFFGN